MITKRRKKRPTPVAAGTYLAPSPAGPALTAQELDQLWAAYAANRADLQLRNRLVEHYAPWVRDLAAAIAHKMKLRDQGNAVGEVLAALVSTIVPAYDGYSGFERWASVCTRRKLIGQLRAEQMTMSIFPDEPCGPERRFEPDLLPDREQPGYDLDFLALTAELSDEQAIVLWLRHYRGMPVNAVAALLKVSPCSVKTWTHLAVVELRKKRSVNYPWDDLPAYL
jgi:DNA-directed RNA polymerase specialized sigma24 family protein